MLSYYKSTIASLLLFASSGCAVFAAKYDDDIFYAVRVRGDDALTESLTNSLQEDSKGFHFVPIDKVGAATVIVVVTSNLTFIPNRSGDRASYTVEFRKGDQFISALSGECQVKLIRDCRDAILSRLKVVIRK